MGEEFSSSAQKSALRAKLKAERAALNPATRQACDEKIRENFIALPAYKAAEWLFCYVSFGQEVDTHKLIEAALAQGKRVAVPRCEDSKLVFYEIHSLALLEDGAFGIKEPAKSDAHRVSQVEHPVCVLPALGFDRFGGRLGYGRGFYDRFLLQFSGETVGLCREAALQNTPLPTEPHDRPVTLIVTEKRVYQV